MADEGHFLLGQMADYYVVGHLDVVTPPVALEAAVDCPLLPVDCISDSGHLGYLQ